MTVGLRKSRDCDDALLAQILGEPGEGLEALDFDNEDLLVEILGEPGEGLEVLDFDDDLAEILGEPSVGWRCSISKRARCQDPVRPPRQDEVLI